MKLPHTTPLSLFPLTKQLCFETLFFHSKVTNRRFRSDFGRVMWVAQLGRDVEAEVVVVFDLLVAQANDRGATYV